MALHENEVRLTGNIGKEIKFFGASDNVCSFSVATTAKWNDKSTGEQIEKTTWHRVKCFGNQAAFMKNYGDKISLIRIKGMMESSKFKNDNGEDQFEYYVKGNAVDALRWKENATGMNQSSNPAANQPQAPQQPNTGAAAAAGFPDPLMDGDYPF